MRIGLYVQSLTQVVRRMVRQQMEMAMVGERGVKMGSGREELLRKVALSLQLAIWRFDSMRYAATDGEAWAPVV
jgi:hypothetical protein